MQGHFTGRRADSLGRKLNRMPKIKKGNITGRRAESLGRKLKAKIITFTSQNLKKYNLKLRQKITAHLQLQQQIQLGLPPNQSS